MSPYICLLFFLTMYVHIENTVIVQMNDVLMEL